jgi:hypothetical protein
MRYAETSPEIKFLRFVSQSRVSFRFGELSTNFYYETERNEISLNMHLDEN